MMAIFRMSIFIMLERGDVDGSLDKAEGRDMTSFLNRFEAMVAALREHPLVEVYEVWVGPSATNAALRDAEKIIGMPLPQDLRSFYVAHDGVFLEWGLRENPQPRRTEPFGYPDYGQPPGCINLLPVSHAMSSEWEEIGHVNEIQPDHQAMLFGAVPDPQPPFGAVCIDNFSKYNHADLILGPEPVMVVSSDHGADMDSSDYCSFSTYLEMTLAIWGSNRYSNGSGIGWTRTSQRLDAWTKRPTLDETIAWLRAKEQ
jgi:hypothetical protein